MMRALGKPVWRTRGRRLCSGVTLLAYLAVAIGFPVPDSSARSAHACGQAVCACGTAEQCKASGCGCPHSPAKAPAEPTPDADEQAPGCCSEAAPEPSCCKSSSPSKKPVAAKKPTEAPA